MENITTNLAALFAGGFLFSPSLGLPFGSGGAAVLAGFIFCLGASYDDDERTKLIDWIDNGANGMTSFSFGIPASNHGGEVAASP